jgi:hypothetical protein
MKRWGISLTRAQVIILSVLAVLDIIVIGGLAVVWVKTTHQTSPPGSLSKELERGGVSPTMTLTPMRQDPVVSIRAFLGDPDVALTAGEVRSLAFGQQVRIYWAMLDDNTRARLEVNQQTGEVVGFLRLGPAPRRVVIDMETAQATALAFAQQHYQGFTGASPNTAAMPLIQAISPDNEEESPKFYSFHWVKTAPGSGALLPSEVRIRVNAKTGQVASYDSLCIAVTVSTQPQIDEATAHKIALEALEGLESHETASVVKSTLAVSTVPVYEPAGEQALLWRVVVEGPVGATSYAVRGVVFIDAHTGKVMHGEP